MAYQPGETGPMQRHDGKWLAKVRGVVLMYHDYSNIVFRTKEEAEQAVREALNKTST